ncbi:MAG: B12-binding domain-containing radical SAM protein [Sedimentisphaerales bacterium]|nr:B12-binding domain-containing radical SAM protein [Sedimentisphaerales bacterium]
MRTFWVTLYSRLPETLLDYPASLPQETLAAALAQVGVVVRAATTDQAIQYAKTELCVFLFSATTSEWPTALDIAATIRTVSPESILIVGGYHVSALPKDDGAKLFDYVVVGEGERSICSIFESGDLTLGGVPASSRPKIVQSPRISDLDTLPFPLRNPEEIKMHRLRGLIYPPPSRQTGVASLLLSRGCNNQCSFCASHTMWGTRLITRGIDHIVEDFRSLTDYFNANALVLMDQAFGEDVAWTKQLCRRLRNSNGDTPSWYCMAKMTIERSLLPEMAAAGCTKIGFGVETADRDMRKTMKHADSGGIAELNSLFRTCNELGIVTKAFFIIGFPWETPEYLLDTTQQFLEQLEANELRMFFFTPFPGTADWQTYSGQLLTRNWADFDPVRTPVVRNPRISVEQYHDIRKNLLRAFYASSSYSGVARRMLRRFPHYRKSYLEFIDHLQTHELITGNEAWVRSLKPRGSTARTTEVA